jgi:hypothetical protein
MQRLAWLSAKEFWSAVSKGRRRDARWRSKRLPFVCRLKDAKAGKSKQNVIEISNTEESVKATRLMNRQQSATPSNNLEALC